MKQRQTSTRLLELAGRWTLATSTCYWVFLASAVLCYRVFIWASSPTTLTECLKVRCQARTSFFPRGSQSLRRDTYLSRWQLRGIADSLGASQGKLLGGATLFIKSQKMSKSQVIGRRDFLGKSYTRCEGGRSHWASVSWMSHWRTSEDKYDDWSESRGQCEAREKFRVQVIENLEFFPPKPILEQLVELS